MRGCNHFVRYDESAELMRVPFPVRNAQAPVNGVNRWRMYANGGAFFTRPRRVSLGVHRSLRRSRRARNSSVHANVEFLIIIFFFLIIIIIFRRRTISRAGEFFPDCGTAFKKKKEKIARSEGAGGGWAGGGGSRRLDEVRSSISGNIAQTAVQQKKYIITVYTSCTPRSRFNI